MVKIQISDLWYLDPYCGFSFHNSSITCGPLVGTRDLRMSAAFSPDSNFLTIPCNKLLIDWSDDDELTRPMKKKLNSNFEKII